MCDQLTNSCKADQTAKDTCARAATAASNTSPKGSGAQADAFNAAFGIQTVRTSSPSFRVSHQMVNIVDLRKCSTNR